MAAEELAARRAAAAREFDEHEHRDDGARLVDSLDNGLTLLADTLYVRVHEDVENMIGRDSMLMPLSPAKSRARTIEEIDFYQVAESAMIVRRLGWVRAEEDWYGPWLARLRFGVLPAAGAEWTRIAKYASQAADQRRLAFSNVLAQVLPESRRAPLLLFQLVPLAVHVATALAFHDRAAALDARRQQILLLPAIDDCHQCGGHLLGNGEQCPLCGNPLWNSKILLSAD
jgi:hypothetical protein